MGGWGEGTKQNNLAVKRCAWLNLTGNHTFNITGLLVDASIDEKKNTSKTRKKLEGRGEGAGGGEE